MRNVASGKITMNFSRLYYHQDQQRILLLILFSFLTSHSCTQGCQFYPIGEYLRFVRIPENLRIGDRVMIVEVHQRHNLTLESIDKGEDAKYFTFTEIDEHMVEIRLAKSLEHIVDNHSPQNILKFRIVCFPEEYEATPSFVSVTIYVEDINNRSPEFVHAPYHVTVEELTPIGLTVFRGISALDLDKPNTANSDIHFSIIEGNEEGKFGLESSHRPALVIKKSLDYDAGDHDFRLVIMASDRGSPSLSSSTTVHLTVQDNDDLPPIFSKNVYRTQIKESYPLSNDSLKQEIIFPTPIAAYDQDLAINVTIQYDLVSGNEMKYFEINSENGVLYLIRDVDREVLNSNTFDLQIRARQIDDPSKFGLAKVELAVIDINDNVPLFEVDVYNISIMENLPNGFSVVQVYAKDLDQGENAEFTYKLEERMSPFAIDPKSGWLTVRDQSQLDREKIESINLKVIAEEKVTNVANAGVKSHARLVIYLLDSNDNSPRWIPSNLYKFQVTLDSEIGSVVGKITAEDPDLGGNGKVVYDLQKSNGSIEELPFEIDSKSGYIYLLERPLPKLQYTLLVEAGDQPSNPSERRYSLAVVQIDVVKAGASHSPEFIGSPYEFWVGTQVGIGTSVGQVKVKDLDPKYTVYDLLHSYYDGVPFAIEERTGIIAVVDELIKYPRHQYDFEAYVTDSRHTLTTNVSIHIVDPIDGAADGSNAEPIELFVNENVGGAVVANLRKEFGLIGRNIGRDISAMEFLLANFDARDKFAISTDGTVYTLKGLDREEKPRHLLTVISQSRGVIQGQGVYQIFVNVNDENDNAPMFDQKSYEGHVRENSNPGTPVSMEIPIRVNDPDEGLNSKFRIELKGVGADKFRVDPLTGKLYVGNIPLDREEKQLYTLELVAIDSGNMSSKVPISIFIDDLNDNAPVFFQNIVLDLPELDQSSGPRELLRSSASQPISVEISNTEPIIIPETIGVGNRIARVLASDRDMGDNSKIFYRIVSENSNAIGEKFSYLTDKQYLFSRNKEKHFVIDRTTGEISVAKPLKPDTEYALNITASDRGGLRTYTGVKIVVIDINNHLPIFNKPWYTFEILEGNYVRTEIGKVSAKDGDSGQNGEIVYRLQEKEKTEYGKLPFVIDLKSGQVFVDGELDREKYSRYTFQAVASDKGNPPMESLVEVDIHVMDTNDNKPEFYNFMSTAKYTESGKMIPIYRTSVKDDILIGSLITQIYANDSDNPNNGNGLVLFHLNNHHKEFYIDSKNGSMFTLTKLDVDLQSEFNVTVVASDLGEPSLSSMAWVLIRILDSKATENQTKERKFDREVYTFQIKRDIVFPYNLVRFNVTEKFKRYPNDFELLGEESVISMFRIEPTTGKLFLTKPLDDGKTYEFLIRSQNKKQKGFDTRQASKISDRFLESNEALVRVTMLPAILKPVTNLKKGNQTKAEQTASTSSPKIISKEGPRIVHGFTHPTKRPVNLTDVERTSNNKSGHFYVGEIAVLTLSAVIFIGGLIAVVSVTCIRRKRRHRRRLPPHMKSMPVEVRLQKQMGRSRSIGIPTRPVLFPMALPRDPVISEETSENTSDTYTDSPEIHRVDTHTHNRLSCNLKANGFSICPDCRKLRKPGRFINPPIGSDARDQGPLKQFRGIGVREISLPSSNDSGIDGSDGQCTCCHSHNSSSDSGRSAFMEREQYEDSLMPQITQKPKSFRRKRTPQKQFVSHISSKQHPHGFVRRHDGVIVL